MRERPRGGRLRGGIGAHIRANQDDYHGFIEALKVTSGGLTVYGGLILALALVIPYLIYLRRRHGVNPLKIADITALPPGTVATRYRTALARLRDLLTRKCHD